MKDFPKNLPATVRKKISAGIDRVISASGEILLQFGLTEDNARLLLLGLVAAETFSLLLDEQKKMKAK